MEYIVKLVLFIFYSDKFAAENDYCVNICLQNFIYGGRHSAYRSPELSAPELSAHSWRNETNYVIVLDVFYDPFNEEAKEFARSWAEENEGIL